MKVLHPGVLVVAGSQTVITGWVFLVDDMTRAPTERESLLAVMRFLADRHGVPLTPEPQPEPAPSIDIERLTQDVIAQARWEPK